VGPVIIHNLANSLSITIYTSEDFRRLRICGGTL
jgi:hypothetical protein